MGSALDDGSVVEYQDQVRVLDRGESVGDHKDRLSGCQLLIGQLDLVLVLRVGEGGGLVQDDDRGVF